MPESTERVRFAVRPDGVAVVTMIRVDPIESALFTDLLGMLEHAQNDVFVRAIVLTSENERVFGRTDITTLRAIHERGEAKEAVSLRHALADRIVTSKKPIVALVHGAALGVGFEIALACTTRILSDDACTELALSDVRVVLAPSLHGLQRLGDLVGFERALGIAMTGEAIDPARAVELGIASEKTPRASLLDRGADEALSLVHRAPVVAPLFASSLYERSHLGKRVFMARAKRALVEDLGRDAVAQAKMISILETYAKRGSRASYEMEREAFAELCVSSATRRSIEIALATEALDRDNRKYVESHARNDGATDTHDNPGVGNELGLEAYELNPPENDSAHLTLRRETLLEIWVDHDTDPALVARAIDNGRARRRVVVVARSHVGGFVRRVLLAYLNEAAWLVSEGSTIENVDRALVEWGFPVGPIALLDALDPSAQKTLADELEADIGPRFSPAPFLTSLAEATGNEGASRTSLYRSARSKNAVGAWLDKALRGPRRRPSEVDARVFSRLSLPFPDPTAKPTVAREEMQMRCVIQLVNEALHCFGEGVIGSARDADVATVVGLGFPAFRGGALAYVDTIGAVELCARLRSFQKQVGVRFDPAPVLVDLATAGRLLRAD